VTIQLDAFKAARRKFSTRYREDFGVEAAKLSNSLADEIGNRMPVDTGSFKDSVNSSVPNPDLRWFNPDEYLNPLGEPDGSRIPELPRAVPWGATLHVSANSPYGPYINSAQVARMAIPKLWFLIVEEYVAGIR